MRSAVMLSHVRSFIVLAGVALSALPGTIDAAPPNIVLVFADDLGMADIGYNSGIATLGAVSTPFLDDLASAGTILGRFYANHACTPARASLMTGRFASRTSMKSPAFRDLAKALNEEEELLPEVLKNIGYQTHMVGKWHLGQYERKFHPVGRGFDSFCGNLGGSIDYFYHNTGGTDAYNPHDFSCATAATVDGTTKCAEYSMYYDDDSADAHEYKMEILQPAAPETTTPDEATYGEYYTTNIYGQKSVDVINAHNPADGPLFLYAAFTAGHSPLQALDTDFDECSPSVISDPDRRVLCAMVKSLDRNVEYIVDALKEQSLWDDTLFVFASDNGGSGPRGGDNGPYKGAKGEFYEGGILAPAFLHFGSSTVANADLTSGVVNNQPIHLVDLFQSIIGAALDGAKYSFKNEGDGRGLYKYLSVGDAIPSDESGINFNFAAGVGFVSSVSKTEYNDDGSYVEAVIATYEGNDFKLCRNCLGQYGDEIYDLTADPYETTDLAGLPEYADVAAFLDTTLASWEELSYPHLQYPTLVEHTAELLEGAGLDPELADDFVNGNRCYLPLDSPEFLCSDCSQLLFAFPDTTPP